MKQFFCLIQSVILIASCTNEQAREQNNAVVGSSVHANAEDTIITNAQPMMLGGCYEMAIKKDTARLMLTIKDSTVTGSLVFNWHEKDGNTGMIKGVVRDSFIVADYTFQSEGITSVREEVFKIRDGSLVHGFGDLQEQNGKVVYKDRSRLQYDLDHPFLKVDCK